MRREGTPLRPRPAYTGDAPAIAPATPAVGASATDDAPTIAPEGGRDLRHDLIAAIGWVLIGWSWWRVLAVTDRSLLLVAGAFVLGALLLNVSASSLWIEHNVRIFRAKGPRTGLPDVALDYREDWTGRAVTADWAAVRGAPVVVIGADAERKHFAAGQPAAPPDDGRAADRPVPIARSAVASEVVA